GGVGWEWEDRVRCRMKWWWSVGDRADGTQLASGSDDNTVRVWDAATGEVLRPLSGHTNWVLSVVYRPDGTQLAGGGDDNTVRVWDAATGELLRTLTGHTRPVESEGYRPDRTPLASAAHQHPPP